MTFVIGLQKSCTTGTNVMYNLYKRHVQLVQASCITGTRVMYKYYKNHVGD